VVKRTFPRVAVFLGISGALASAHASVEPPSDPVGACGQARAFLKTLYQDDVTPDLGPGHKLLFVDPSVLQGVTDVTWKLHPPHKVGALIRPQLPWEGNEIQIRSEPIWSPEEHIWKIWYFSENGTGMATSHDGVQWEKPSLGKVPYQGSANNNMVSIEGVAPERGREMILENVIYDFDDPNPNRRYKALAGVAGRTLVVSPNGVDWKALDIPPISGDDESSLTYDRDHKLFITAIKHPGPYGRSVYLAVSKNFEDWTESRDCLIFHADYKDQELGIERIRTRLNNPSFQAPVYNMPATYNIDVYYMSVMRYQGIYLGFPTMFHKTGQVPKDWPGFSRYKLSPSVAKEVHTVGDWTGFHQVELLTSRNLTEWQHVGERLPILDESPLDGHPYDVQNIWAPSPVVRGDELWFYYTGSRTYGIVTSEMPDFRAICLAKLRLDGFVSLTAGQTAGSVVTKPLLLGRGSLHLNVDAPGGEVRAEIMDAEGKHVLDGFALANSIPATGDHLDTEIKWKKAELSSLAGKRVCIRFTLRRADLYSAWVE
jgi:hypothetical protein